MEITEKEPAFSGELITTVKSFIGLALGIKFNRGEIQKCSWFQNFLGPFVQRHLPKLAGKLDSFVAMKLIPCNIKKLQPHSKLDHVIDAVRVEYLKGVALG